jgi:hypothetical protein
MANSVRFYAMCGAVAALAIFAAPGCSDDEEGGTGGAGGSTGGKSGSGTGGKSGSGTGGSGTGGSGTGGSGTGGSGTGGSGTGGSGTGGSGTGGSAGAPGTGGSAGAPGTGGSAGAPGTGGSAGGGAQNPSCADFCTENIEVCGEGSDANAQYDNQGDCVAACGTWAPGDPGVSTTGDNLACRVYHTNNASMSAQNATDHCPHTGDPASAQCVD